MAPAPSVAQRAASRLRRAIPVIAALVVATTATFTLSSYPVQAAYAPRVVIVVGPSGGATSDYLSKARSYAAQARAAGASVTSILTPHATWERVVAAAQGANLLIYLGHGNGWPSPYAPFQGRTKNGLGLNPWDGSGNTRVKYYGEEAVAAHIRLAPDAVVLLNRLCYASGNGEPGSPEPSWGMAVKRADNYAAGFLRTGATTVIADGHTSLVYELAMLFGASGPMTAAWSSDKDAKRHTRAFPSVRTPGYVTRLDPDRASTGFYRSIVTRAGTATGSIRIAALAGKARTRVTLRTGPDAASASLGMLPEGSALVVRGSLSTDDAGRTWVPVVTRTGTTGYVAGWVTALSGSARPRAAIVLRSRPSTEASRRATVRAGVRVEVLGSAHDRRNRAWLKVRTPSGQAGWIAAWLTAP